MSRPNGYLGGGARQPSENSPQPSLPSQTSNMSRAQRFENEKQRLQESCFSKLDEGGQRMRRLDQGGSRCCADRLQNPNHTSRTCESKKMAPTHLFRRLQNLQLTTRNRDSSLWLYEALVVFEYTKLERITMAHFRLERLGTSKICPP